LNLEPLNREDGKTGRQGAFERLNVEPLNLEPLNLEPLNLEPLNLEP